MNSAGTFFIKRGDRAPSLVYSLQPPVDLTGASGVVFNMRTEAGVPVVSRAAAVIEDAAAGVLRYDWQSANTVAAGTFQAEFEVTLQGGLPATFPNFSFIQVVIVEDIA